MLLKSFFLHLHLKTRSYSDKMGDRDWSSEGRTLCAKWLQIFSLKIAKYSPWQRPSSSTSWEARGRVTAVRRAQQYIHVVLSLCSWPKSYRLLFCCPVSRGVGSALRCPDFCMEAHASRTCITGKGCGEVVWAHLLLRGGPVRSGCSGL